MNVGRSWYFPSGNVNTVLVRNTDSFFRVLRVRFKDASERREISRVRSLTRDCDRQVVRNPNPRVCKTGSRSWADEGTTHGVAWLCVRNSVSLGSARASSARPLLLMVDNNESAYWRRAPLIASQISPECEFPFNLTLACERFCRGNLNRSIIGIDISRSLRD